MRWHTPCLPLASLLLLQSLRLLLLLLLGAGHVLLL